MKTDILPYYRVGSMREESEKTKGRKLLNSIFSKSNLLLLPAAFLLGRGQLIGGLMPFGLAIYASSYGLDANRLLIAAFVILGMISGGAREQIYITVAGMILFNAFNIPFKNNSSKSKQNFRFAVIAFISVLIPAMIAVYLQGFLLYDLLKTLLCSFVAFLLIFVFRHAVPVMCETRKKIVLSGEEMISIAILAALALSGLGELKLFGFGLKNILSILTILIFSYKCGPGVGAAAGVTVGLMVSMSTPVTPLIIGSYAFCGLLSGVFRSLGKVGASLGFVMGNAVLTLYLNGSTEVLIYLREIVAAVGLFVLIPQKLMDAVSGTFNRDIAAIRDKRGYSSRIRDITVEKLNKFSMAFKELSKTFSEISQTKMMTDKHDISSLFDRVADKVCRDCSLCLHCWDRNFYNTYQVMFKIIERLDAKGRIEQKDIPRYFLERCERVEDFVEAVNNIYEIFKVDMVWKSKIGESRNLVSQQLEGLSKVISNLATEINVDIHFKSDLEDTILLELNKAGIKTGEAIVFENKWGKYEISIFHKGCGGNRNCVSIIEKVVSNVVGRKMTKENIERCQTGKNGQCALKLIEEETFRVTTGIAKLAKYDGMVSGDSYTFMSNGDGKFIIALSDGMGSGQKAATQSRATISLLEQFMESGFDKDTTIKLINSILVLKSNEDAFSTIDLSVIDLYDGEVEFVKIGAVPTFIKRAEKVEVVRSATLPVGILSNIEMELTHKQVGNGDFIIMMTDGIVDSFQKGENRDTAVLEFLQKVDSSNPQQIADLILDEAYKNCGGKPEDDMMVLAAKVWKRAS